MIAESFAYHRPRTLAEALALLSQLGEDAKILAGGHSLIPAMKLRLARPRAIVDLGRVQELTSIMPDGSDVRVGAMATHAQIAESSVLRERCPLLPLTAAHIGDRQVRNKGTIGGSLVHADPAADWPAAALALDATLEIAGPAKRRTVPAVEFFVGMLETAIRPDEILVAIRVPVSSAAVAYVKTEQKASGFAICGVAAVVDTTSRAVRIGVTGVSAVPYRARAVETQLAGKTLTTALVAQAAQEAARAADALGDIHASAEYRAHLATVNVRRALERAARLH
jgi:carbon-monoxide dehydrogenase medium subunit